MNNTVLIVAAHTDDEALGCGGTIARHAAEGDAVYAIFMADGVSSREKTNQRDLINRRSAAEIAREILGIQENFYLGFPDNRLDTTSLIDVIKQIERIIEIVRPNIIYTHHYGDLNVDHRITHQAVLTACRPMPGSSVKNIYSFEVMSSTEWSTPIAAPFLPNHYVDIGRHLDKKMDALNAYQIEMRNVPHSRSLEHMKHLALHRGFTVGVEAAEAFYTVRTIL